MPGPISQVDYWNGDVGERWTTMQAELDRVFAPLTDALLAGAALRPGERMLDVGCGCGDTALRAAGPIGPAGAVTAVDVSRLMLARARARPASGAPITWLEADAQTQSFAREHDVALSRFGVMFFEDSRAAFANIRRALRPGGRLAVLCWRGLPENPWVGVARDAVLGVVPAPEPSPPDMPGPFRFADGDALVALLGRAGFARAARRRRADEGARRGGRAGSDAGGGAGASRRGLLARDRGQPGLMPAPGFDAVAPQS